ncbi:hypothetical protein DFH06DRAFT_723063 [Mycena polygramma]|nr:hypothetical protein DFH06DRAFT_723063 [Mycena polygramma]
MPASASSNRFIAIGVHKVPANSSLPEFRAKMEAFADALVALPAAQEQCLKYELMVPNDKLDSHNQALGFPAPQPVILVKVECESQQQCTQDLEVANAISGAAELGDARMFSADEITRIDQGSVADTTTWVGIFKRPLNLSTGQFHKKLEGIVDVFVTLPIVQRHLLKHTVLFQNDAMASEWQSLGVSVVEPFAVIIFHGVRLPLLHKCESTNDRLIPRSGTV